ncbi:hypothetical protein CAXC1_120021 [Candidatus Xenohaliotis californiensis]|uniref:Uncharacterized protein n=1 Tax=Candidatus Xenohaliotis californiensis TaxID=84677 RepID=A0ABP0EUQ0_9RICK|nr:hypothetical protein CAXC1_120021 [Candidatus Xenohaliotis californiensis]
MLRNTLIFVILTGSNDNSGGNPSISSTSITKPSAGLKTNLSSSGTMRGGSRKKNNKNKVIIKPKIPTAKEKIPKNNDINPATNIIG